MGAVEPMMKKKKILYFVQNNADSCKNLIALIPFLIYGVTILMNDYGRNDEMQLKRLISAEIDIENCFFLTALHQCPLRILSCHPDWELLP